MASLEDLRRGVEYRLIQDYRLRNCIMGNAELSKALNAERKASELCAKQRKNDGSIIESQAAQINYLTIRATDSEKKSKRKEPWATIGKVVVVAGGIEGGYELAKTFKFIQ